MTLQRRRQSKDEGLRLQESESRRSRGILGIVVRTPPKVARACALSAIYAPGGLSGAAVAMASESRRRRKAAQLGAR